MTEIVPIAMPGTHQRFMRFFEKEELPRHHRLLDLGAGHGAFSKRLHEMGYAVSACDLFPEEFRYQEIECKKVDITSDFPYADKSFDGVIAIEVSEHIIDHENFFREVNRILRPGGTLYLSTPNILSLKSRIRFLFTGFYYSFKPLELRNYNGLQHVASLTIDQYNYIALKHQFKVARLAIDRRQNSSRWLRLLLAPALFYAMRIKGMPRLHNQKKLLLGRLLFLAFEKES